MPVQSNFPKSLPQWVNPMDAQIAEVQARMAQPQAPMFTPEQVEQRRTQNDDDYALGLLGMLSGNRVAGNAGGQIFKKALGDRELKMNERGTADPLSGKFSYSPDYLRERDERTLDGLNTRRNALEASRLESERRAADKLDERQWRAEQNALARGAAGAARGAAQDKRTWDVEDRMADDFNRDTKTQQGVVSAYKNLQAIAQKPDASSDMAFIFTFMKALDPSSTVNAGEYANASNTAGVPDRVRNMYNRAITGNFLNAQQRAEMLGASGRLAQQAEAGMAETAANYSTKAQRRGLNAENITGRPSAAPAGPAAKPAAPKPAAGRGVPAGVDPAVWQHMTPEERALWQ